MNNNSPKPDDADKHLHSLLRQVALGERDALLWFTSTYGPRLKSYLMGRCAKNQSDAEDISVSILSDIILSMNNFDYTQGSFEAWFWTLARNNYIDWLRSQRRFSREFNLSHTNSDSSLEKHSQTDFTQQFLDVDSVSKALKHLSCIHRKVITLFYFQHKSLKQISADLNKSEGACRIAKMRALKQLKIELEKIGYGVEGTQI